MKKKENDAPQESVPKLEQAKDWRHFRDQCKRFSASGETGKFEVAFNSLELADPPTECINRWRIHLAAMKKDFPSAIRCLQEIWNSGMPFKPEVAESKLTRFYRQLEDPEIILDCARHALTHIPSYMPPVHILAVAIAETFVSVHGNTIPVSLYKSHGNFKRLILQVIKLLKQTEPKQMRRFIGENIDHLDAVDFGKLGASVHTSIPEDHAKYKSEAEYSASSLLDQTTQEKVKIAKLHVEQGNMESARTFLSSIAAAELTEEGQFLTALIDDMPADAHLTRPELAEDLTDSEIVIAETPNASGTVIVFTGLAGQAFMSIKFLDRYFSALGLSAIYLRDEQRYLYLKGISQLGKDMPETISGLRGILKRLNTKRLFTFGTSAGGYGAIRYGIMLEAESILCFGAATHMHSKELRAKLLQKRLLKICDLNEFNLDSVLKSPICQKIPVHLYYGELMHEDRLQAEFLGSIGNVTLHPVTGYKNHQSLAQIVCERRLLSLIAEHYQIG